jgi:hypothetical protein
MEKVAVEIGRLGKGLLFLLPALVRGERIPEPLDGLLAGLLLGFRALLRLALFVLALAAGGSSDVPHIAAEKHDRRAGRKTDLVPAPIGRGDAGEADEVQPVPEVEAIAGLPGAVEVTTGRNVDIPGA